MLDGVSAANLTNAGAVASEFNAEFNMTASVGETTLLVINDLAGSGNQNQTALWLYTENGTTAEIQTGELQLLGIVNANANTAISDFSFV
jgi:hypothetical protein